MSRRRRVAGFLLTGDPDALVYVYEPVFRDVINIFIAALMAQSYNDHVKRGNYIDVLPENATCINYFTAPIFS